MYLIRSISTLSSFVKNWLSVAEKPELLPLSYHVLGVANGKIRDLPRRRDPSLKSEPETLWYKVSRLNKVKTNHAKTRLRDLSKMLPRFRDPVKIFRDPRLSRYHSPPLVLSAVSGSKILLPSRRNILH